MENDLFLKNQLISYIGNKRKLLDFIGLGLDTIKKDLNKNKLDILDGFAGSGVVSRYFKQHAEILLSNDYEYYSYIIGKCYLSNKSDINIDEVEKINLVLNENKREVKDGIIRSLYSPKNDADIQQEDRVFYTNDNAVIIDTIRKNIDFVREDLRVYFLAPLLSEASIHVNTSGVFKGFYKNSKTKKGQYGGNAENCLSRIKGEIILPVPIFSEYECDSKMFNEDINALVSKLPLVDVAYFDPPYNQHPYGSNYFMLNVIAKNEYPENISKVSGIPSDWYKSAYNKYKEATKSFNELINNTNAKYILLSYNNEGIIPTNELIEIMSKYGKVDIIAKDYPAFRGSRNRKERSNKVEEYLYILKKN